ncbi:ADP-ribosylglycohydrolase family protein [Gemella sanguinis]|jgi:ADP-ribosylation/crystallin J1|uniref:ADP-ribosylglycohydrolase family protein n=1 Tax=Gemella sanguinis TaxID=84135 RepID=UPI0004E1D1C8|nr:ADP-ribosylglycohydrolase family protein [Gemella sanguinis]NKZ25281.1 ADP-ribosylglycohydrolase family protein [Gemella sanguinis]
MEKYTELESKELKEQTQALILGLAIGDALGVPVEFEKRNTFKITDMTGFGTYNQPVGTWSDDTSLTLVLLEHLSEKSDLSNLMNKFKSYRNGYLTPYGECFDIGIATSNAIDRYIAGIPIDGIGGKEEWDNGNGALMRISPLAILLKNEVDLTKKIKTIEKYTKLTHAHPRSIVASILYIQLLIELLFKNNLKTSLKATKLLFENIFDISHPYRKEYEEHFKEIFIDNFFDKKESEILSTGYVVDTLKAVIWCLGNSNSFEGTVLKAVNLGDDTDTIGGITGTLAGIIYGLESIPNKWLSKLAAKSLIESKIDEFVKVIDRERNRCLF